MKNVLALVAICLALSFTACTKKEAAPEGAGEAVEGTTSAPTEGAAEAPTEEMEEKKDSAAPAGDAAPADAGHEAH